jgi:hypothetical protein
MAEIMNRERWQRAEKVLGVLAFFSFSAFVFLQLCFCNYSARSIDLASGAVNLINCHGTRIYLTNLEQLLSNALLFGSIVLVAPAIAIEVWIKPNEIRIPPDSN